MWFHYFLRILSTNPVTDSVWVAAVLQIVRIMWRAFTLTIYLYLEGINVVDKLSRVRDNVMHGWERRLNADKAPDRLM